ncbi:hypothetical protein [Enterococcus faecium]|uniref:hypothetical protein n=1 Tax=Enterococcus faecium TaxID=1352 RepID=UPI002151BCE9
MAKSKKKRLVGFHSTVFFYQIWEKKTYQEYLNKLVAPLIRGYYAVSYTHLDVYKRQIKNFQPKLTGSLFFSEIF